MSYTVLAQKLAGLSGKLQKHASQLDGPVLAKAAATFSKSLATFEKKMESVIRGCDPSIEGIQALLKSPAKKMLKAPVWAKLLRQVFREEPGDLTAAGMQKLYLARAVESDRASAAFEALRKTVLELSVPAVPVPKDKGALQAEFLRIGGLDEEEVLVELSSRWKLPQLKNLAKANAIQVPDGIKRERLERDILHYARRASTNIVR